MTIRPTTSVLRFNHPFTLPGHPGPLPAGSYDVLIEDELLHGLSFEAFRRVSTFLQVKGRAGVTELRSTTEQDLEAALIRDRAAGQLPEAHAPGHVKETR